MNYLSVILQIEIIFNQLNPKHYEKIQLIFGYIIVDDGLVLHWKLRAEEFSKCTQYVLDGFLVWHRNAESSLASLFVSLHQGFN